MPQTDDTTVKTGAVEWFDAGRGVGVISCDGGEPPCRVRTDALSASGLDALAAGDRVRFRVQEAEGERIAVDLTVLLGVQRWENEGGAMDPDASDP